MVCQVHGDYADISYLKRTDKVGIQWVFPEDAKVQQTSFEQIMASGFEVKYIQSAIRIRCVVDKTHLQMNYLMKLEISQTHLCKYNTGLWRIF